MHKRHARAAVDGPDAEPLFGPLTPEEAFWRPPLQMRWAHRRLPLDAAGRRWATAVARQGNELLVRVLDTDSGHSRWLPAGRVLGEWQLLDWAKRSDFYR